MEEVHAHTHPEVVTATASSFTPETPATGGDDKEQSSAPLIRYTKEESFLGKTSSCFEEDRKSAAAAVAAKLAASTSSAQMLSYVFSSLASESVNGNPKGESPPHAADAVPFDKRPKLENLPFSYFPPQHPQHQPPPPPLPPFPHPDLLQNKVTTATSMPPPPPPLPPLPQQAATPPFIQQTAGSMMGVPYGYAPMPPPGFSMPRNSLTAAAVAPPYPSPPVPYQSLQGPEGGFFNQPAIPATPPISRS